MPRIQADAFQSDCSPEQIRAAVVAAIAEDRIGLSLQPVVSTRSQNGDHHVGFYEGLIRIMTPQGRVVPAACFIDAVSGTPLMQELDCAALRCGIALLAQDPGLRLSINLSPESLFHSPYSRILQQLVQNDQCQAERLILEITEQAAMIRPVATGKAMARWRAHGISFALDDFGAGQTSLGHLRAFRFDILKVDGTYATNIARDKDKAAIMRAINDLATHFDMLCVAEHVSSPEDAAFLTDLGVDCLQGYLYGRPRLAQAPMLGHATQQAASA
ncbi:MAG: EAL domain-containing protein [Mangrovicoccus sp.]|nr:EAL domain-containing protein [Mangrovicoccus sp.]